MKVWEWRLSYMSYMQNGYTNDFGELEGHKFLKEFGDRQYNLLSSFVYWDLNKQR